MFSNNYFERIAHHRYHNYMVYPVWIRTCFLTILLRENCAPQVLHLYGLSPVWVRIWDLKLLLRENCTPRVSHLYGLNPLCGHGHVSSKYHLLRIVHTGITFVWFVPCVDMDMLQ